MYLSIIYVKITELTMYKWKLKKINVVFTDPKRIEIGHSTADYRISFPSSKNAFIEKLVIVMVFFKSVKAFSFNLYSNITLNLDRYVTPILSFTSARGHLPLNMKFSCIPNMSNVH